VSDEFRWNPETPPGHDHAWTRVYRARGKVAHISELIYVAHLSAPSSWDDSEGWYGTGSQEEYETAAAMPLCPKCFVVQVRYEKEDGSPL
jgi:hypothetical protein